MTNKVNYSISKGLPWERLILVKDKRTHRVIRPISARASIQTSTTGRKEMVTFITTEGGIMIALSEEDTADLPVGDLSYDVLATYARAAPYDGASDQITRPVAAGTITVTALNNITPLEDTQAMEIRFKQRVDFRRNFTWRDAEDNILTVQDAFMQAKDSAGANVLDLRWYATKPSEETVIALTGSRRGYIAPIAGATLELHVSDKNTVPAGVYPFDMFVKDSAGDWDCLASGTVVVEAAVSVPPT
jgi:hypothetical protein